MTSEKKLNVPVKHKLPQPATPETAQGRDFFRTPRYATELLIPYIPTHIQHIWECACGEDHIVRVLKEAGYTVSHSDLHSYCDQVNFLDADVRASNFFGAIITNPPYSLKQQFYKKCLEYNIPFALLIPADYSGWLIDAVRKDGCEKLIPSRRIDYITPTNKSGEASSAMFHSLWLTRGFNLGQSETFVDLSIEMKRRIE